MHNNNLLAVTQDTGGDLPTIVFLHGIASSSATWDSVVPLVQRRYRCITIDLLGFGESPKPENAKYDTEDHLRTIDHTIRSLELDSFVLAGHSLGALLGAEYAAWRQSYIERLVMVSPPVYLEEKYTDSPMTKFANSAYMSAYEFMRHNKRFTITGSRQVGKFLPTKDLLEINNDNWNAFSLSLKNNIENQQVMKNMHDIHCPVDIFYGELDQFLVNDNIKTLAKFDNVNVHSVLLADHVIRGAIAEKIDKALG